MADMLKRIPVREQDAKVRATNFEEVCYGYNKEEAMEEATRCLNCKNARCIQGCPVSINIPGFISKLKEGDIEGAYQVNANVSAALKVMLYLLVSWSVLWQIMHWSMISSLRKQRRQMVIRWL